MEERKDSLLLVFSIQPAFDIVLSYDISDLLNVDSALTIAANGLSIGYRSAWHELSIF